MMRTGRGILSGILMGAVGLAIALPGIALGHSGAWNQIFQSQIAGSGSCLTCHGGVGGDGGFGAGTTEDDWHGEVVNRKPNNGSAANAGKLLVHPYQPWNSYLLDKLKGDLQTGQGAPMPQGGDGQVFNCPGAIPYIEDWILRGALQEEPFCGPGQDPKTDACFLPFETCDYPRPDFQGLPSPAQGIQLSGDTFTVARPTREAFGTTTHTISGPLLVNRIEIAASAGTEYVTVTRVGDDAPLAVARGEGVDVDLPDGVAIELQDGDQIEIRQLVRNDYWTCPVRKADGSCSGTYTNVTDGDVVVNLHTVASANSIATPFIEATGTDALFVPPRFMNATGGVWQGGSGGALVGIWSDRRVVEAGAVDLGVPGFMTDGFPIDGDILTDYLDAIGPVSYECVHSNGFTNNVGTGDAASVTRNLNSQVQNVSRPVRYACAETTNVPPGLPGLAGGEPVLDCHRSIHYQAPGDPSYHATDCGDAPIDSCVQASLTGGDRVNDGRCTLIGLSW